MSERNTHKAMIVGGDRHCEWIDLLIGAQAWVDIRTGDTYRVASMQWAVTDPGPTGEPEVVERYKLRLAVHPRVAADPASMPVVHEAVRQYAMTELMRAHAERLPVEPSSPVAIPDTPATLFGPNGEAL